MKNQGPNSNAEDTWVAGGGAGSWNKQNNCTSKWIRWSHS